MVLISHKHFTVQQIAASLPHVPPSHNTAAMGTIYTGKTCNLTDFVHNLSVHFATSNFR